LQPFVIRRFKSVRLGRESRQKDKPKHLFRLILMQSQYRAIGASKEKCEMGKYCCIVIFALAASGCVVVGSRERFEYSDTDSVEEGAFVPKITYAHTVSRTYLPFFRIDLEHAPYDLVLSLYDQANAKSPEAVVVVVIEVLQVESESEGVRTLLSAESPEVTRTFKAVHQDGLKNGNLQFAKRFDGVIKNSESFKITTQGYGVTSTGEKIPFRIVNPYRYDGHEWTCWTTLHELNGV